MNLSMLQFKGPQIQISNFFYISECRTDEILHYTAFHLGLHYFPKYWLSRMNRVNMLGPICYAQIPSSFKIQTPSGARIAQSVACLALISYIPLPHKFDSH